VLAMECAAAENLGLPALDAAARHARGIYDADVHLLRQAVREHRHPLVRAAAHEDIGAILAESDRPAARDELECALAEYRKAGSDHAAERVRRAIGEVSEPAPCRGRERPRWGWLSLTATELRVARVVAEGLTNAKAAERMFLSRHTIDFHLRQIYCKLGISSRVELTRLVLEHAA
jgi:DNA-binding CsgD family transcriptional regulator